MREGSHDITTLLPTTVARRADTGRLQDLTNCENCTKKPRPKVDDRGFPSQAKETPSSG